MLMDDRFVCAEGFMGSWESGYRCFRVRRCDFREDEKEIFGVIDAILVSPIRLENPFFYSCGVEISVREAIDGEDISMVFRKPLL